MTARLEMVLHSVFPAWPVDPELKTGHRAVFASASDTHHYLQPVTGWAIVEGDGQARNCVPMVFDPDDWCLMPCSAYDNFVGVLEPGDTEELYADAIEEKRRQMNGETIPDPVE